MGSSEVQKKGTMNETKIAPDKPVNIKVKRGLSIKDNFLVLIM